MAIVDAAAIENKLVDDLFDGNPRAPADCKLIANSTWTGKLDTGAIDITLEIVLAPEGAGCNDPDVQARDGCKPGLTVRVEKQ